jgi:hypothetical protein
MGRITKQIHDRYFAIVRGKDPKYMHWLTPVYREIFQGRTIGSPITIKRARQVYQSPERLSSRLTGRPRRPQQPSALERMLRDDWIVSILMVAFLVNLGLLVFLVIRFDGMNELIPLHYDAQGFPDRIEQKSGIYILPMIGFAILFGNALLALAGHHRERAASVLLAVTAMMVQVLLWLAALNILS